MQIYPTCLPVAAAFLVLTFNAHAEQAYSVAVLEEDFAGAVPVSGSVIVGLTLGSATTKATPEAFELPNYPDKLCLSAKTRDGRYWASGKTEGNATPSGWSSLRKSGEWTYTKELSAYRGEDLTMLVSAEEECGLSPKPLLLPVRASADDMELLTVSINSQRAIRVAATLTSNGLAAEGNCMPAGERGEISTAFNYRCVFDVTGLAKGQEAELVINRLMRTGKRTDTARVYLP